MTLKTLSCEVIYDTYDDWMRFTKYIEVFGLLVANYGTKRSIVCTRLGRAFGYSKRTCR